MTFRIFFSLALLLVLLSGCVGTKLTKRSTDVSQSYPSLHSVPERPPRINFEKTDRELEDLEEDYARKNTLNEQIRKATPPIKKPEDTF